MMQDTTLPGWWRSPTSDRMRQQFGVGGTHYHVQTPGVGFTAALRYGDGWYVEGMRQDAVTPNRHIHSCALVPDEASVIAVSTNRHWVGTSVLNTYS